MPDTISRQGPTAREFADLICADPVWLRAEFDAIVAASFGGIPMLPPPSDDFRPRNPRPAPGERRAAARRWRAWPPERRERSPPPRRSPNTPA
ncbi:hypothetical protein [Amycolatopsis sp. WGS_07]|uniref:hypothetical protein n=1 Tax=Amycolatopsis sp. WGS_07 TaxID=3076764 RepID=UPI0038736D60